MIAFAQSPAKSAEPIWRRRPILVRATLIALTAAIIAWAAWMDVPHVAKVLLQDHPMAIVLFAIAMSYLAVALLANLLGLVLVAKYRPVPSVDDARLPVISVLVPAYNEGPLVAQTLRSIAASNYPHDKLQVIAVDDGSTDDTWRHMSFAAGEIGAIVQAIRCPRNRGKRWALYEGFRRGRGEIFITIDSDSIIEPDTLRNLVSPMVVDQKVGAVAGNVRILNTDEGLIPLMLSVSFIFSFDFVRSAESVVGSVFCTPGALSAYRATAVKPVLRAWLEQKYMGRLSTIGEDRALTNMIMEQGYTIKFQSNARVLTTAPVRYRGLTKMFTRWARSNVRETIYWLKFGFRRYNNLSVWARVVARFMFIARSLPVVLGPMLTAVTLLTTALYPLLMLPQVFAWSAVGSLWMVATGLLRGRKTDAVFGLLYGLFCAAALWWINGWSLLTSHRGGWLTRGGPAQPVRPIRVGGRRAEALRAAG